MRKLHEASAGMTSVAELRRKLLPGQGSHPEDAWDRLVGTLDSELADIKSVGSAIIPEVAFAGG